MLRCIINFALPDLGGKVASGAAGDPRQGIFDTYGGAVHTEDRAISTWLWPKSTAARGDNDRYHLSLATDGNRAEGTVRGSDSIPALGAAAEVYYAGWVDYQADTSDTSEQHVAVFYQNRDDITNWAYGLTVNKGSSNYKFTISRVSPTGQTGHVSESGTFSWTDPTFNDGPLHLVEVAIRLSDKYLRWWVNGTEITAGYTNLTGGQTINVDGRIDLRNTKFAGKAANPFPVVHGSWVLWDDVATGNLTSVPLGTSYKPMLHAIECDVTGKDDFTPDPDPGSGLHWSNIDDQNDDDYIFAAGDPNPPYTPTDVLKLAASTGGSQMAAVQTQDGASATIVGVCVFIGYTNTTGGSPNLFPADFKLLAFLDGEQLYEYALRGYAAYENWGWWRELPEKPGGGNWTLSDFNNLRVGIKRETTNASDFHLRQIVLAVVGTNLAQPTPAVASPVSCTVGGPAAAPTAAFVPRVMVY